MKIVQLVREFHDFVFRSRALAVLILVPAMNMLVLLWSIAFQTDDYDGYMPIMWLTSTFLGVLTAYEYKQEKKKSMPKNA